MLFTDEMQDSVGHTIEERSQKPPEDQQGPPQVYDQRSLYEKLQEQKDSKQAAFDEKYSIRKLLAAAGGRQADLVKAINLGAWTMMKQAAAF